MSMVEILNAAKNLALEDQAKVAQAIWDNIEELGGDPSLTPGQARELDRRLAEFEKNPREGVPWEKVKSDINQRFGWK